MKSFSNGASEDGDISTSKKSFCNQFGYILRPRFGNREIGGGGDIGCTTFLTPIPLAHAGLNHLVLTGSSCDSEEGLQANLGIREKTFRLPTEEEVSYGRWVEFEQVLPNMRGEKNWFWTSTMSSKGWKIARVFNEFTTGYQNQEGDAYLRCVSR